MRCALARCFTIDGFTLDQGENAVWGVCKDLAETTAGILPHFGDNCVWREPKTSIDQTDVTPGSAMTHGFGL